jgi:hypothetical protein
MNKARLFLILVMMRKKEVRLRNIKVVETKDQAIPNNSERFRCMSSDKAVGMLDWS